jgi:hypothetical protein
MSTVESNGIDIRFVCSALVTYVQPKLRSFIHSESCEGT